VNAHYTDITQMLYVCTGVVNVAIMYELIFKMKYVQKYYNRKIQNLD
jgi:hypothetical protein